MRNLQFFEQFVEVLAIFGEINRFGRCADDFHARFFQRQRQVQRSLPAKLHDHADVRALRGFVLVDRPNIFESQRLEVEAVAGVVVGRDGLRIAVDHDRLVAVVAQRERGVAAAVIEFNSLPDAIGPAAENDDFLLVGRRGLVFLFVGRVKVRREAFELGGAGVDAFVDRHHAVLLAQVANFFLAFEAPDVRPGGRRKIPCAWQSRSTSVGIDSIGCFSSSSCWSLISLS